MLIEVDQSVPKYESYAAERTRGLYNVDADDGARFQLKVELPIEEEDWRIGVIVGPSGSGKSSVLHQLAALEWDEWEAEWGDEPIIEQLARTDTYAKATASLASVGLGSVPSWLRPRGVLSMGEGFRADLAQLALSAQRASSMDVMVDEFTSVLDRQVAQVGAGAFAKAWRRTPGRRIILFSCHYDILEWIQPDWWLDTATGADQLVGDRQVVQAQKGTFPTTADRAGYTGDLVGTLEC